MQEKRILSLVATRDHLGGAWVSIDGEVLALVRAPLPPLARWAGFAAMDAQLLLEAFHRLCAELLEAPERGKEVVAVGLSCARESTLLVGSENIFTSPLLFGHGLPVSRSEVPEAYLSDPALTALYRGSPIRQIECREPEALLGLRRVVSLDALLAHELSGEWVASSASPPAGAVLDPAVQEYSSSEDVWRAAGLQPSSLPLLIRPSNVRCQLSASFARRYGLEPHVPVIATGDPFACLSYGLKSTTAGWCIKLSAGLEAGWIGPTKDTSKRLEISVQECAPPAIDVGDPAPVEPVDEGVMSSLVWAELKDVSARIKVLGPRRGMSSFRARTRGHLLDSVSGRFASWADDTGAALRPISYSAPLVEAVAVGCEGLRYLPGSETGSFIGLRGGHEEPHLVRAYLEGMLLELRRWRSLAKVRGVDAPRFILDAPWELNLAHLMADILAEPIIIWEGDTDLPVHTGQALSISRDLELGSPGASPTLTLSVIEPSQRARSYERYYALHLALVGEMSRVLI